MKLIFSFHIFLVAKFGYIGLWMVATLATPQNWKRNSLVCGIIIGWAFWRFKRTAYRTSRNCYQTYVHGNLTCSGEGYSLNGGSPRVSTAMCSAHSELFFYLLLKNNGCNLISYSFDNVQTNYYSSFAHVTKIRGGAEIIK